MNTYKWLNLLGISSFFLFIIFSQLLWIFDPIRLGEHTYWIDVMDYVLYYCTFIPLIWLFCASQGFYLEWRKSRSNRVERKLSHALKWIRILIICSSSTAIYLIIWKTDQFISIFVTIAMTCALVLIDMIVEEVAKVKKIPWRAFITLGSSFVLAIFLLWPTSFTVTYPGLTVNMNKFAQVAGGDSKGEIMGVLVFERPAFPVDWVYALLFPQYEISHRQILDIALSEQLQRVQAMKIDANRVASALAFQQTGLGQGFTTHGAVITGILSGAPVADQLQIGDVIVKINGESVTSVDDFTRLIATTTPGMDINLTIIRSAKELMFQTKTYFHPEDITRAILGTNLRDDLHVDLPRDVFYYQYLLHQGGPSHGAMLALTLINQLTPNGVTNGNIVAGTGSLRVDGTIGRIGGIKQKAYSVERAGSDVFFVPASQYNDAQKGAKELNIVPVHTLSDILQWLEENPKE